MTYHEDSVTRTTTDRDSVERAVLSTLAHLVDSPTEGVSLQASKLLTKVRSDEVVTVSDSLALLTSATSTHTRVEGDVERIVQLTSQCGALQGLRQALYNY